MLADTRTRGDNRFANKWGLEEVLGSNQWPAFRVGSHKGEATEATADDDGAMPAYEPVSMLRSQRSRLGTRGCGRAPRVAGREPTADRADGFGFKWEWDGRSSKHFPFDWGGP
jgi:hypothetical protein